jgi:hypothetical protein
VSRLKLKEVLQRTRYKDASDPDHPALPLCTVITWKAGGRVCNSLVILLWLMLPRDHLVSWILHLATAGVKCRVAAVKSFPALHFSVKLHFLIITHVQTQSNRVCNSYVILLWLMLPRDHFVSRILYFTTAGVKCRMAAVKSCPVLHFSVAIFSGPSGSLMPTL